jgi:hypothetical protein
VYVMARRAFGGLCAMEASEEEDAAFGQPGLAGCVQRAGGGGGGDRGSHGRQNHTPQRLRFARMRIGLPPLQRVEGAGDRQGCCHKVVVLEVVKAGCWMHVARLEGGRFQQARRRCLPAEAPGSRRNRREPEGEGVRKVVDIQFL